jgi:orotidine-5'-phosphate decarboxylase
VPELAPFSDRLSRLVEKRHSQIALGLDPHPQALWPGAFSDCGTGRDGVAEAVLSHCREVISAVASSCVAVKLQLACFERLGAPGWQTLESVVQAARDHELLCIADAKRGDVPPTAQAYAEAFVGETHTPQGPLPGMGADALTVNPLLGGDALEPLVSVSKANGAGLFSLVLTSNPGAADIQELRTDGEALYERLARLVGQFDKDLMGECGLSGMGAVTAATRPERLARLRQLMPRAIFLLPGVGAQGGSADRLGPAFLVDAPASGIVTASRSIVNAHRNEGGDPQKAAKRAAEELRKAVWAASTQRD